MIDQDIPLPPRNCGTGRPAQYPYSAMRVGDSFFCQRAVSTYDWTRRTGFKFSRRAAEENGVKGYRVWRVQ